MYGYTPATWRYRIGDFRVFYLVDQTKQIVFIVSVDNRRDTYA
ncbi:MAG: type II toxin-antitoxin system RelE/ParE family toxin [Candidatus Hydrogenedentes bacterium]|nr:type II toxin-antitoxin system RelE/ParE family toxin [Candidatus Hydrogenedentota bacterium]